jgi:hypothetical protein
VRRDDLERHAALLGDGARGLQVVERLCLKLQTLARDDHARRRDDVDERLTLALGERRIEEVLEQTLLRLRRELRDQEELAAIGTELFRDLRLVDVRGEGVVQGGL